MELLADYLWPSDFVSSASKTIPPEVWDKDFVDHLDRSYQSTPAEFMLFLGDFVYADVPYYFGDDLNAYRRLYRRNYQSLSFRRVYERLRGSEVFTSSPLLLTQQLAILFTYDDHEFVNNYAGASRDLEPYLNGSKAFFEYNARTNFDSPDENQFYYYFSYGADAAFFVLDTRRHRSTLEVEVANRTMLGQQQLGSFLRWLSKVCPDPAMNSFA
jgi:alkaline phosphatase D